MRDPITDAAQDPSCLLCLTPDRGGSWWSRLHPPMPRNFAEDPMAFADSYTAQDGIGTDDFTLSVDFSLLSKNVHGTIIIGCMSCIYYDSTKGHQPYVRILKSDGTKGALYPVGTSHMTEDVASIKVIKTGQNVRMVVYARDGSVVRDMTKPLPDGATVTSLSEATTYPGSISAASIRNDTTGETVWQAAYSDLYDTSNPWPSPVPRNFAEEPMTWYDAKTWFDGAPAEKMIFDFEFEQLSIPTTNRTQLFGINGIGPFSCEWVIASDARFVFRIYFYDLYDTSTIGDPYLQIIFNSSTVTGKHAVHAEAADGIFSVTMDETDVSDTRIGNRVNNSFAGVHRTTADCTIQRLSIFVENYTKFNYPSEAERVRLLTKTNVRTDRGVFEAAYDTQVAGIATPLDFRGNTTSKTFIARAFCPAHDPASEKLYIHPFFGQGQITGKATDWTFQFALWEECRSGKTSQLVPAISDGTNISGAHTTGIDRYLNQWHTYAMVVDYRDGNCYFRVFVDGTLLTERGISRTPVWNTPAATTTQETTVGIRRDPNMSFYAGSLTRVSAAMIFDRALSAAEIAALTPKQA